MNLEYLRHGKALCGKVFRRFVETFNFHNDFIANLKGDADLPVVGGKVKVDRTDERHPVIRCQGCGGGGGGEEHKAVLPWSFSCTEDPDTHERTGGWTNGLAQFGYDRIFVTPDLESDHTFGAITISGTDTTDDGRHYLEVNTLNATAEVKVGNSNSPGHDPTQGILRIVLGRVEDGKLTSGFHINPVIYKYV